MLFFVHHFIRKDDNDVDAEHTNDNDDDVVIQCLCRLIVYFACEILTVSTHIVIVGNIIIS